jgi:integrase
MSHSHSTPPTRPAKPYADFPLFPHASGQWAKKIRGKTHYFGVWDDPDAALQIYLAQKDALHAGRQPRPEPGQATVKDAANAFLNHKKALLDSHELSPLTWDDYKTTADLLVNRFGKHRLVEDLNPEDFAALRRYLAKSIGPLRLGNTIQRVRSVFKFALDAGLIDRPIRFGPGFQRPSKKVLRLNRADAGPKLFTAEEVRRLIAAASVPMRAMILLGINCGFGNADCGNLPLSAVDLEARWIDYPRPKTGIARRCSLWPETVQAIQESLTQRPEPKKAAATGLVFVTKHGAGWARGDRNSPVTKEISKLMKALGINGRRGLGFYTIRHTFRTVADEAKDQPAADYIMGHEVAHMSSVYREKISDDRLRAAADHVRTWLFPSTACIKSAEIDESAAERV